MPDLHKTKMAYTLMNAEALSCVLVQQPRKNAEKWFQDVIDIYRYI
jgi:hypothetical protein